MSVGGGFVNAMAAAPTSTTTAVSGEVAPRRRGKSKAPNFKYDGPVSVIRVELDVTDPAVRRRVERQWGAVFRLRRAIQRDAAARCRAYWAAHHERVQDPTMLRERLGLSRKGTEAAAKAHIEASGWMRDHLTKAVGSHVADEVWQTMDRHLFADSSGRRHGPPRIGSWWDFTRIAGRARSHTKASPVWKPIGWSAPWMGTWQRTDTRVCPTGWPRRRRPPTSQREPRCWPSRAHLAAPVRPASGSWADHDGALAVVFTGLPGGDLVLPVRPPQGAGQWAHLCHFLASRDLVASAEQAAPGPPPNRPGTPGRRGASRTDQHPKLFSAA
jgi:hypothetical protein